MTQDIIEMTRKAGWSGIYIVWAEPTEEVDWSPYKVSLTVPVTMEQIEAFYKLATAKAFQDGYEKGVAAFNEAVLIEREACANVADKISDKYGWTYFGNEVDTADEIAAAIRARGEA
jgi:hypothetical protein